MNGKKAKSLRKLLKGRGFMDSTGNGSRPTMRITVDVFADGRVEVSGFPSNFNQAMQIIHAAAHRVSAFFMQKAMAGEIDNDGSLKQHLIVQPTMIHQVAGKG